MRTIILPGWQHDATHWQAASAALTERGVTHSIVELPGFGNTPYDPALASIDDVAAWLESYLMKHFAGESLLLCGHSYGGRLATLLAGYSQLPITGLLLIGSPNIYRPTRLVRLQKKLAWLLTPIKTLLPESFRQRFRSDDYAVVRNNELQTLFASVVTNDQSRLLPHITTPVKLLWGEQDTQAPLRLAYEIESLLPNATLTTLQGVGHDVHIEKPQLLAATIETYVKECTTAE